MMQLVADIALRAHADDFTLPGRFSWQAATYLCSVLMADADRKHSLELMRGLDSRASTDDCARICRSRCASPISPRIAASACSVFISYSTKRSAKRRIAICIACGSIHRWPCSLIHAHRCRISRSMSASPIKARSRMLSPGASAFHHGNGAITATRAVPSASKSPLAGSFERAGSGLLECRALTHQRITRPTTASAIANARCHLPALRSPRHGPIAIAAPGAPTRYDRDTRSSHRP